MQSDLIKLTGMWTNKTAKGDTYYSGSIGWSQYVQEDTSRETSTDGH